jgi:hypothetical protein
VSQHSWSFADGRSVPETSLNPWPFWPQIVQADFFGRDMQTLSARAEPVTVEKHGRPVVIVLAVEEYQRLKMIESEHRAAVAPPPTSVGGTANAAERN